MIPQQFKKVGLNLLLVMAFYQVIRFVFFIVNQSYFEVNGVGDYLWLMLHSLRFDVSVLFIINALYVFFGLLPLSIVCQKWYGKLLNFLFVLPNSIAFVFDMVDIAYFPFQRKRMSAEVFNLISRKSDFIDLLPNYVFQFWYVPLLVITCVGVFIYLNNRINKFFQIIDYQLLNIKNIILILSFWGLAFLAIRGGWQLKPILTFNALAVTSNANVALVYNTAFSLTHTLREQQLNELHFFSDKELAQWVQPIHLPNVNKKSNNCNVVIIILESVGKSYTQIGGRKSYSPCLDSIMQHGLTFTHAFANANISASGIPAILAGIPNFMEEPFATSPYGQNSIDALPRLLGNIGYSTSFFHGGTNGTMSFDLFAKNAGFQSYFGRNEYPNQHDFDGTWGIWDEPYLQYFANELERQTEPFFSTVFTLSSHAPFHLPSKYAHAEFSKFGDIQRVISYTDLSLKKFFQIAATKPWFKNTLFVITPDHNYVACHDDMGYYNNGFGLLSIPIVFYKPNEPKVKGTNNTIFQQINILPTVLDFVNYPKPYFAFGKSAFDTIRNSFVFHNANHFNQFLSDNYLLTASDTNLQAMYHFGNDSFLKHNLLPNDSLQNAYLPRFRAFQQLLHESIISNKHTYH
jgi:phosphoglycerol transferase MdoB-like AlkP superfamily enzyme